MLRAKLFRAGRPLMLSDVLPLFENMGVEVADERPYPIVPRERDGVWIYDFGLTYCGGGDLGANGVRESFQDTFVRAWRGEVENDAYNRLVLGAGAHLARDHRAARDRQVPPPGAHHVQRQLRGAGARRPPRDRAAARGALPGPLRPAPDRPRGRRGGGGADRGGDRRGREPRPGPDPADVPRRDPGDPPHELLPDRPGRDGQPSLLQARPVRAALAAAAAAALRDLRLLAAHRGRAPARRCGRARRHPLVRPARGLPHRGARPDEGPDGEERRDRAGRRQGRLRGEAPAGAARGAAGGGGGLLPDLHPRAARPDGQHRRRRARAPARRRALRRRRPVPRRRRRQGHRDLLRHRQRDRARGGLLARRRVRLRRVDGLRPQEDGHHRARRVGVRQAPLPGARARRAVGGLHGRRHRRHVGRRVRERDAAVAAHPARRRVQPPARVHRPGSRPRAELRGAQAPLRAARLDLGRLRPRRDLCGRRRVRPGREVGGALARGARGARPSRRRRSSRTS